MGDDSERADRASDADGGSSGDDESGSDSAAGTPTDVDGSPSDPSERSEEESTAADSDEENAEDEVASDEGATEVDAAETGERLRAGDGSATDADDPEPAEGAADETSDDESTTGSPEDDADGDDADDADSDADADGDDADDADTDADADGDDADDADTDADADGDDADGEDTDGDSDADGDDTDSEDADGGDDTDTDGDADADGDDTDSEDADGGDDTDTDGAGNDGANGDDIAEPPDVPDIDPGSADESEPEAGFESVGSGADADSDGDDVTGGGADADEASADDSSDTDDTGDGSDDIWPGDRGAPADAAEVTGTDGGMTAAAGDAAAGTAASETSLVDDGVVSDGPETDEEMPLADHIEEMIRRLAVVLGIGGIITLLLYPGADLANSAFGLDLVSSTEVIDFLWNKHVPGAPELTDRRPRVYGPLELLLTELKVAALGGLVVGLPVFVYETYLFMRPGLYPKERRYYLAAVPTSIVLAFVGISFAHFIVLPAIFAYFTSYTTGTAVVAFGLKETFNLILILMGYNAIIFQIPLFIMLAIMMNLVTRTWLEDRRLLFWGAFLGVAFLVSPDPTGMAPIIIGATMIALFEGTLLALRWTNSGDGAAA